MPSMYKTTPAHPSVHFNCAPWRASLGDMIVDSNGNLFVRSLRGKRRMWINTITGEQITSRAMREKFAQPADPWKGLSLAEIARVRAERDEFFSNGKERNKRRPCSVCGKTGNTRDMSVNITMMTFHHVGCAGDS